MCVDVIPEGDAERRTDEGTVGAGKVDILTAPRECVDSRVGWVIDESGGRVTPPEPLPPCPCHSASSGPHTRPDRVKCMSVQDEDVHLVKCNRRGHSRLSLAPNLISPIPGTIRNR